jgi:hypothetical protein
MSFENEYYVNLKGHYCKRTIEQWSINTQTNQIFGYVRTCHDCVRKIDNVILAYIDTYVVVRIGPQNYALILGGIDPNFADQRTNYIEYLKTKAPRPFIQI